MPQLSPRDNAPHTPAGQLIPATRGSSQAETFPQRGGTSSERPVPRPPKPRAFDPDYVVWHPDALEHLLLSGLDEALVAAVLTHPQRSQSSVTATGTWAVNLFRGDLVVSVGLLEDPPMVLSVRHRLRDDVRHDRKPGGGVGTSMPTTFRELRRRAVEAGLEIQSGSRHDRVVDPRTGCVVTTLAGTPSDHRSLANTWATIRRHLSA